jgi:hypothetical protein
LTRYKSLGMGIFLFCFVALLGLVLWCENGGASTPSDASDVVNEAATQLVKACIDPKTPVDDRAVATLVDYVMSTKQAKQMALPKNQGCAGAYLEFDSKITFSKFAEYSYNPLIPTAATRPSSLRYSIWANQKTGHPALPSNWRPIPRSGAPVITYGFQREADSPDLHTGVYHEYDLKRLLIFVNHNGHQALISVSKQINASNVGKKGFTLGEDNDWIYYYSDEPGTTKKGLGWAKSYIYDYFSIGVYVEPVPGQAAVRSAVFQWLKAGWSGMNFVRSNHILNGLRRFAQGFNAVMESPRLPPSGQLVSTYQSLIQLPHADLLNRYTSLQQSLQSAAIRMGKMGKSDPVSQKSLAQISKEQMAEELMVDYMRVALGKRLTASKEPSVAALVP